MFLVHFTKRTPQIYIWRLNLDSKIPTAFKNRSNLTEWARFLFVKLQLLKPECSEDSQLISFVIKHFMHSGHLLFCQSETRDKATLCLFTVIKGTCKEAKKKVDDLLVSAICN